MEKKKRRGGKDRYSLPSVRTLGLKSHIFLHDPSYFDCKILQFSTTPETFIIEARGFKSPIHRKTYIEIVSHFISHAKFTCQAFKHALRQNTGLRTVYLHFRQTQDALPKSYGVILAKTYININYNSLRPSHLL